MSEYEGKYDLGGGNPNPNFLRVTGKISVSQLDAKIAEIEGTLESLKSDRERLKLELLAMVPKKTKED